MPCLIYSFLSSFLMRCIVLVETSNIIAMSLVGMVGFSFMNVQMLSLFFFFFCLASLNCLSLALRFASRLRSNRFESL